MGSAGLFLLSFGPSSLYNLFGAKDVLVSGSGAYALTSFLAVFAVVVYTLHARVLILS